MLSLVEKLEDLKAGLNNDTYIDVILQSLPPSYDPYIVNYNMNRLEKSIHELINILVQYEATTHKSEPAVLVGEASTSMAKGKGARRWKRKKGKGTAITATASTGGASPAAPKGKGKGKVIGYRLWSLTSANDLQVLQRSRKLSKDEMILGLGDGKAIAAEAVGSLRLVVSSHIMIDLKDIYFVPSHISEDRIRRLVDSKSLEIDDLVHLPTCESCLKGKMTKKPFVGQSAIANGLLNLVHTDVCGPLSISAIGGFSYFITFTDEHSRYGYVYLMMYKSEAFGRFKQYRLEVENQTNRKIKALRSDRDGEYLSGEFIDFLKENGILSQWTPPGMPQLNGVADRRNRILLDMVRPMMSFTEVLSSFWGYAFETTAKLLNIASSKLVPRTPYEIWHDKLASYKYLRVWGSRAYVKRLVGDKLDSRSSLCRFIEYPKETAGYYFYDLAEQRIFVPRIAIFLEKGFPSDSRHDEVLIEESSGESHHDSTTSFEPIVHTDGVPVLRRSTRESRVPERYGFVGMTSQLDNDPKTYRKVMSDIDSNKWLEAMKSKMNWMGSNQVWTLVDPPKGARPVGCKWVYKCKLGADGEVTAFKARLVVKGYTQLPGVDFEETYSPVAMAKSIRILLAIAAWSINGLKQAFRSWNTRFDKVIRGYDFIKNDCDPCIYKKISGSSVAYLVFYVDDILLIENDVKMLGDIKAWLSTQFSMKDMGEASYILGIKIYRDRSGRYQACAGEAHWGAVKSILKYLKRTKDMFLIYGGGELILEGYSDASFQSDDDNAKSQSDFVFKLNGGVVAWKSSKKDTTADSTTEAEYIATSEAAKEAVWMKNYIQELGVVLSIAEPVVIFCDNNGPIAQAKEPRSHHHSKHNLRCYHLLREMVSIGD
ncbi:UNVERIFIED_CONTAM: Retrovirus-related Pol polyprotein from transposon TNT 1-94 [Sesamum radiatum]|uniref:Retrovirus-related Pol polyprotein from transposon TNT 1-94 n=1 Tax=Sesamum radiatum TaxID=300843 RepID=A0AAW2K9J4_SESRA